MDIPGEDLGGVYDAIEFLKEANLGKEMKVGRKVAVIGGGNSAIDSARVALKKGSEEVHIFYRRERKDMPAITEEVEAAEEVAEAEHIGIQQVPAPAADYPREDQEGYQDDICEKARSVRPETKGDTNPGTGTHDRHRRRRIRVIGPAHSTHPVRLASRSHEATVAAAPA